MQVLFHKVVLSSDIVSGSIVVVLRPSLPVLGISLILGNDVASGKVEVNLCVSDTPNCDVTDLIKAVPGLFPACAVTCAMAHTEMKKCEEFLGEEATPNMSSRIDTEAVHGPINVVTTDGRFVDFGEVTRTSVIHRISNDTHTHYNHYNHTHVI